MLFSVSPCSVLILGLFRCRGSFCQTETRKVSTYSKYIELESNDHVATFKEGVDENLKHENECWIDALVSYCGDTLMSENRKERLRLTREKVISIIGKSEAEFH